VAVTFRTVISGGSAVGIEVPADAMAQLGPAKRYPVVVTVNGYTYRNSVSWYKGAFMIAFSAEHRAAAGLTDGGEVEVALEVDDAPRILELTDDFIAALTTAGVYESFRALSYSKQRALGEPWMAAKSQETRDKNLAKIVAAVS
jgi:Domain of unknown function (DUF1905)/Bacteriocin-protection, YdeI or OmpD-Associated